MCIHIYDISKKKYIYSKGLLIAYCIPGILLNPGSMLSIKSI